jgi:methylated-DNA-protein-cysteine methyltransferase-like protein
VSIYEEIYNVVRMIPQGNVSTYGGISRLTGKCTPRMVGYALHALPSGSDIPWHRVVNSRGRISLDPDGVGQLQRTILEEEGIIFSDSGHIDLRKFGWP